MGPREKDSEPGEVAKAQACLWYCKQRRPAPGRQQNVTERNVHGMHGQAGSQKASEVPHTSAGTEAEEMISMSSSERKETRTGPRWRWGCLHGYLQRQRTQDQLGKWTG